MSESEILLLRLETPEVQAQIESILERAEAVLARAKFPEAYQVEGEYGTRDGLPHPPKRFNVNRLMTCFPQLHLETGYELDYWYHNDGRGGRPFLYTRSKGEEFPPSESDETAEDPARQPFLPHFFFEPSLAGYLQFVIFSATSSQFYLFWHAGYDHDSFVFSLHRAVEIMACLHDVGASEITWQTLAEADFSPALEIYSPGFCRFSAVVFNEWSGFKRRTWDMIPPAYMLDGLEDLVIIPYETSILY